MNNPFDFFEKIYYLNPDQNFDRKIELEKEFSKYSIKAERLSGHTLSMEESEIITKNGGLYDESMHKMSYMAAVRGVTLSHLNALFLAKYKKFKNVLIFEDDVIFPDSILEDLTSCLEDLEKMEWDIFFLGCNPVEKFYQVTDSISRCGGLYMSHAYAVNNTFYDKMLNFDFERCWVFDQHVFGLVKDPRYNCFMSIKNLASQRPGFSGSTETYVDYNITVEHNYKTNFIKL